MTILASLLVTDPERTQIIGREFIRTLRADREILSTPGPP